MSEMSVTTVQYIAYNYVIKLNCVALEFTNCQTDSGITSQMQSNTDLDLLTLVNLVKLMHVTFHILPLSI